jgi:hypothetical protein
VTVSGRQLFNAEEVSEMTGVPLSTLAQWRYRKQGIPYLRIGRLVRYDAVDVDSFLQRCRVEVRGQLTRKRGFHGSLS